MKLLCDNFEFSKNFLLCQLEEYNSAFFLLISIISSSSSSCNYVIWETSISSDWN